MLQRAMHVFSGFALLFFLGAQSAWAVSFDRIDVASHVGEPFYAEAPLRLNGNEALVKTAVDLGSSSDYRILEVYRDPVVDNLRTDIIDDERGPRVIITSEAAIDTAFFNLVLKVRYGRATHYKKMPIFLEAASAELLTENEVSAVAAPVNSASVKPETSEAFITKVPEGGKTAFAEPVEEDLDIVEAEYVFKAHGDWARSSRYGPMVFGDTITTVAQRLRLDDRFTNNQVMVALFEKNKTQFGKENINLIKAGSYLDVPSAEEVDQVSVERSSKVLSEQEKVWRAMVKQPKYAAVADAQKTRYTRRVRVGQNASGVASVPMTAPEASVSPKKSEIIKDDESTTAATQTKLQAAEQALITRNEEFQALQEKVAAVEDRLTRVSERAAEAGVVPKAPAVTADLAALEAQSKRLEIVVSRLKSQLEETRVKAGENQGVAGWMMSVLAGLGLVVLALAAAVVSLLRREPKHPAEQNQEYAEDAVFEKPDKSIEEAERATKMMEENNFDMPSASMTDTVDEFEPSKDNFDDEPLEETPDFTDEETGQMEAFDPSGDETPDPSVNYLEEADVYLRYGMENEAEKQVRMALKLQADDPEIHAKLIQIHRARGDESSEAQSMSSAKAALSGAAFTTFEGLISSDSASAVTSGLDGINLDGIDFGDINFDSEEPESTAGVSDGKETANTDAEDLDFSDINFEFESSSDDVILPEAELETSFDFSDMDASEDNGLAENEIKPADALTDLESMSIDLSDLDMDDFNDASDLSGDLDLQVKSALEEHKQIDEELKPDVTIDDEFLSISGSDLNDVEIDERLVDDLEDPIVALTNASAPMADNFDATAELSQIEADKGGLSDKGNSMIETAQVTTELDDLMNDLDGLLDEDDKPKS